jgi:serine/threonine protein kinase
MNEPDDLNKQGGRYQLSGEIVRGEMSAVLRCRDVDLGRDVAVKVLLEKYTNRPEVARRLIQEAQIGGQLQHPGVVPVYDIGRFGDRPFIIMKLVKGKTLAAILSERAEPTTDRPRLLSIMLLVAQTMAYAHAKGVIHRELQPTNIMVGAFGEVQVMDWGLAKVLAEGGVADEEPASRLHQERQDVTTIRTTRSDSGGGLGMETEASWPLGTLAYMPPEQANGHVARLDRRADVFSLGAILCEILTGKPPYTGRSCEEVRHKASNGDLADARARLNGCGADKELLALTKACLSPEAIDRPKDAGALAEGLVAYLDGVQVRLRQAELAEAEARARAAEESRRRWRRLALAAMVLLTLTLGGWLRMNCAASARGVVMQKGTFKGSDATPPLPPSQLSRPHWRFLPLGADRRPPFLPKRTAARPEGYPPPSEPGRGAGCSTARGKWPVLHPPPTRARPRHSRPLTPARAAKPRRSPLAHASWRGKGLRPPAVGRRCAGRSSDCSPGLSTRRSGALQSCSWPRLESYRPPIRPVLGWPTKQQGQFREIMEILTVSSPLTQDRQQVPVFSRDG